MPACLWYFLCYYEGYRLNLIYIRMSAKIIVVSAVILLVVGTGVVLVISSLDDDPVMFTNNGSSDTAVSLEQTEKDGVPTGAGRMVDLYEGQEHPIICEFPYADESYEGVGSGFFLEDQMRLRAVYEEGGLALQSNVIKEEGTFYIWGDGPDGAFAVQIPATEENMAEIGYAIDEAAGRLLFEEVDYDCREWHVDHSMFDLPVDVGFQEIESLL